MRKAIKDEFWFMVLTLVQCILPFLAGWLIRNYFTDITYQKTTVAICVFLLTIIYVYAHHGLQKAIGNFYYYYVLMSIIVAYSLGACSLDELRDIGFNFSKGTKLAATEYLQLKVLFNSVALVYLPKVIQKALKFKGAV